MYSPTKEELTKVIHLLHSNGIDVSNSKAAYAELKLYEGNPSFCMVLAAVFGSESCPVPDLALPVPWPQYRQLAAITLKNNIAAAKHSLGEEAVKEAARCGLQALRNPPDTRIARASAQIVSKVTSLTTFEWWSSSGLGDLAGILLNELLQGDGLKTLASLYALQYLMEDVPKQVGHSSANIIIRVSQLAISTTASLEIRKAAFKMCFNIYEQSSLLDWNVDTLSGLQQGVVNASFPFAQICTQLLERSCEGDTVLYVAVLRSCLFLLDYFDYFPEIPAQEQQRMVQFWISNTLQAILHSDSNTNQELLSAAIDLITNTMGSYDSSAGEGPACFLVAPIASIIDPLVPVLIKYAFLSEEEVAHITEMDDYRIRDNAGVRLSTDNGKNDISQDNALDDDEAAMTLRRSALRCIDSLCSYSSSVTFTALMAQFGSLWGNSDWRAREVGIVLVGTMATGCTAQLGSALKTVTEQLLHFVNDANEHICVSSIAIWSLSRLCEQILTSMPTYIDAMITSIANRMVSPSRRIQHSSVSALNSIITTLRNYYMDEKLKAHYAELVNIVSMCLPTYSTANLSLLIDLTTQLLASIQNSGASEASILAHLSAMLKDEHDKRMKSFENSYANLYVNEAPNALIDMDVFCLDRGIISVLSFMPDNARAETHLNTWSVALGDILSRGIIDDTDLIFSVISLCCGYVNSMSTTSLQGNNVCFSLSSSAMQLLQKTENKSVKLSVAVLLTTLLRNAGGSAFPSGSHEPLLSFIAKEIAEEDDAQLLSCYVGLVSAIVVAFPSPSDTVMAALSAVASSLRCDVYGDTEFYYITMAFDMCRVYSVVPNALVNNGNIEVICALLARSENNYGKAEATAYWCASLCAAPGHFLSGIIRSIVQVIFSWQQEAHTFAGTLEALRQLLQHVTTQCGAPFQEVLMGYPQQAQHMISQVYFS